ncbi:MAG: hypothetical protein H6697_09215 [Myxococcales bacterium]|nr:hypothetical protein [Myxococcales bacterium]
MALVTGATATAAAKKALSAGVDIARKVIADKLKKDEARKLAVYWWGAILFELRRNIEDTRQMTTPGNQTHYALISTKHWDALFDALARVAPGMNRMVATVDEVYDGFREISRLLRAAVDAPGETSAAAGSLGSVPLHTVGGGDQWTSARLQGKALLPRAIQVFTDLRDIIDGIGRDAFDAKEWQTQEAEILPDPLP